MGEKGGEIRIFCLHFLGHLLEMVETESFKFDVPLEAFKLPKAITFRDFDDDVGEDVCGNYIITYIYSALCKVFCPAQSVSCYQFVSEMLMLPSGHREGGNLVS